MIKNVKQDRDTKVFQVIYSDGITKTFKHWLPLIVLYWLWKHRSTKLTREHEIVWSNDYFVFH